MTRLRFAQVRCGGGCACRGYLHGTSVSRHTSETESEAIVVRPSASSASSPSRAGEAGTAADDDACWIELESTGAGLFKLMGLVNMPSEPDSKLMRDGCLMGATRIAAANATSDAEGGRWYPRWPGDTWLLSRKRIKWNSGQYPRRTML